MRLTLFCAVIVAFALARPPAANLEPPQISPPYDVVILNGRIVDGTGSPWYAGDLAIKDGRIAAIGRLSDAAAKEKIDARGRVVAPGFIDMLGQS